ATGQRPRTSEERLVRNDGSEVALETAALRVTFQGEPAVMVVGRDVTERNRMQAELARARDQKARVEKLAAVGQLAAGVAHDLRNPLSAVRSAFHWLGQRVAASELAAEPRVAKATAIVEKELRACASIVDELLDFARERPLDRKPTRLDTLVADAASVVRVPEHVELAVDVPADLPALALDAQQFRQVLVNLMQNAAEAVPDGRKGAVRVAARLDGPAVALTIADDGVGIPEAHKDRIFEPLFTTRAKGTGLGLAIVASIVKRHGASIDVASKVGEGTTFSVRIPSEAVGSRSA
ncbi:MAG TPA: ATP-binding protein, partial [Minicystis sp.]|nr:ATP-binding protein [Minicystis sp.]